MEIAIESVLILNFLGSIVYAIIRRMKGKECFSALFFIFLPIFGFLLYLIPQCLFKIVDNQNYDRESLVKRFVYSKSQELPAMQQELDVVPILDAMAVSDNNEKRGLLLEELKKDLSTNYKVLLAAGKDEDSETAHYIAAAKMEVYRSLQDAWMKAWKKWKNDQNEEVFHEAFAALEKLIASELLSGKEEILYKEKYIRLYHEEVEKNSEFADEIEATGCLAYLIELEKYEEAEEFYKHNPDKCRNEKAYHKLFEMWYQERNKEEFYKLVNQLREDKEIRLSSEGLSALRFWLNKEI